MNSISVFVLMVLANVVYGGVDEHESDSASFQEVSIKNQIKDYKAYVNESLLLEKQDPALVSAWTEELQVKQINVTTAYRMQMIKHRDYNFHKISDNDKWTECIQMYKKDLRQPERVYYKHESRCLKIVNFGREEKKHAINQVQREIRKWRKSYRYLENLCQKNNPDDDDAYDVCLVGYMQKDDFDKVFQRLIALKLELMKELYSEMTASLMKLGDCLKTRLSTYLESVRTVMETLNKCYGTGRT